MSNVAPAVNVAAAGATKTPLVNNNALVPPAVGRSPGRCCDCRSPTRRNPEVAPPGKLTLLAAATVTTVPATEVTAVLPTCVPAVSAALALSGRSGR